MAIGPKNRNYNVQLYDRFLYRVAPKTGPEVWSTLTDVRATSRVGILQVNNPWRAAKPDGLNPTARSLFHEQQISARGDAYWIGGQKHRKSGMFSAPVSGLSNVPYSSQRTDLVNRALLDALSKLKDQKFNAGVAIAEAEGVARMVIDASETVIKVRDFLRHGKFSDAYHRFRMSNPNYVSYPEWRKRYWDQVRHVESVRRARKVPEGWLYYHYGLKPTVNDIDGLAQEFILKSRTNPNFWKGKVMGYAKVKSLAESLYTADWVHYRLKVDTIESVRVVLHVSPKNELLAKASTLGVTNPAEALWNRAPFSFLVDYVVGVGEWLHVLDAWVGWDFGEWEESWRKVHLGKAIPDFALSQDGTLISMNIKPAVRNRKDLDRVIHNTLYSPMANVRPRLKIPSANQLASILSLLATSFRKPVRP